MGTSLIVQPVGPLQGNCYFIVAEDGRNCIVVDPGEDDELLAGVIAKNSLSVAAIFITHGHSDHLGATAEVVALTGAPVYGSREAREVLAEPDTHLLFPGMPEFAQAQVTNLLEGGEELDIGGIRVAVHATPGHSPGSLTYRAHDGLFCGDLIFSGSVGRTDLPGGSFAQLAESIAALARTYPESTIIYPGHGGATSIGKERADNPFLSDIRW